MSDGSVDNTGFAPERWTDRHTQTQTQ